MICKRLVIKLLTYHIIKKVRAAFDAKIQKRMQDERFQWGAMLVIFTMKKAVRRHVQGLNVDERNLGRLKQSLNFAGVAAFQPSIAKAVNGVLLPFMREMADRNMIRRKLFVFRAKIDQMQMKLVSNVCIKQA